MNIQINYKISTVLILTCLLCMPLFALAQPEGITIHHGDNGISDAHESFKDRGMRSYQDLVDVDKNSRNMETFVNVVYGNLVHSRSDLYIPGRGLPLRILFVYNSGSFFDGRFGFGWQMNYNVRYVANSENNNILIVRPDDQTDLFIHQPDDSYLAMYGVRDQLSKTENGFMLKVWRDTWNGRGDYSEYFFDSPDHHYVTKILDRNGNVLHLTYNEQKQLITVTDGNQRSLTFDYTDNKLTSITDPSGRTFTYAYDGNGDMVQMTNPLGGTVKYTYSQDCHDCLSITDANSSVHTMKYNDDFAVSEVTDPLGNSAFAFHYEWTGSGTTTVTDAKGRNTIFTYDDKDCVTQVTDALGNSILRNWDDEYLVTQLTDELGGSYVFTYDDKGNILTITDPLGNGRQYTYDDIYGLLMSATDGNGNTTVFGRDNNGNLIDRTNALGDATQYVVDQYGQTTSMTDALSNSTQFVFDQNGNLTSISDPKGNTTGFTYDIRGNRLSMTDALGNQATYTYDALNRLTGMTTPLGDQVTFEFDATGNLLSHTDPTGYQTRHTYDALNQRLTIRNALNGITSHAYDETGNRISTTNEEGHITGFAYDDAARLIRVTDAAGGIWQYVYDAAGHRTAVTDPNNVTALFEYDALGQLTQVTNGTGGTSSVMYDAAGNPIQFTDGNGNTTTYIFNALNRLLSVVDPMGGTRSYMYDAVGNCIQFTNPNNNATQFEFDALGKLITRTDALGGATRYTYDAVGNQISRTNAEGNTTILVYDALGRNTQITTPMGNIWQYQYDAAGHLSQRIDGEGISTTYTYDALQRLTQVASPNENIALTYDAVGNVTNAVHQGGINDVSVMQYDPLGQLLSIQTTYPDIGDKTVQYTYDGVGNRKSMTYPDGSVAQYVYDGANRLTQVNAFDGIATYSYDAGGRQTGKQYPNNFKTAMTYDANDRALTFKVMDPSDAVLVDRTYTYDAAGNRIQETHVEDNTRRDILYDALNRLTKVTYTPIVTEGLTKSQKGDLHREYLYEYNSLGFWEVVHIDDNPTRYDYNLDGRVFQTTSADETRSFEYNKNGWRTGMTTPYGRRNYSYTDGGHLSQVSDPYSTRDYHRSAWGGLIFNGDKYQVLDWLTPIDQFYPGGTYYSKLNPGTSGILMPEAPMPTTTTPFYDTWGSLAGEHSDQDNQTQFTEWGELGQFRDLHFPGPGIHIQNHGIPLDISVSLYENGFDPVLGDFLQMTPMNGSGSKQEWTIQTRRGGNRVDGDARIDMLDDRGGDRPDPHSQYDMSAALGGPILKDKVWSFKPYGNEPGAGINDPPVFGWDHGGKDFDFEPPIVKGDTSPLYGTNANADPISVVSRGPDPLVIDRGFGNLSLTPPFLSVLSDGPIHRKQFTFCETCNRPIQIGQGEDPLCLHCYLRGTGGRLNILHHTYSTRRNSLNLTMDGNYFIEDEVNGKHELRFGMDYYVQDQPNDVIENYRGLEDVTSPPKLRFDVGTLPPTQIPPKGFFYR